MPLPLDDTNASSRCNKHECRASLSAGPYFYIYLRLPLLLLLLLVLPLLVVAAGLLHACFEFTPSTDSADTTEAGFLRVSPRAPGHSGRANLSNMQLEIDCALTFPSDSSGARELAELFDSIAAIRLLRAHTRPNHDRQSTLHQGQKRRPTPDVALCPPSDGGSNGHRGPGSTRRHAPHCSQSLRHFT